MTYATDIDSRTNRVGWAVSFDGVDDILVSHTGITVTGKSGTAHVVMTGPPSGSGEHLDRERSIVMPPSFTVDIHASPAMVALFARRGGVEDAITLSLDATEVDFSMRTGAATYSSGDVVHINRETIILTSYVGAGAYEDCVRGAYGTQSKAHAAGTIVSSKPRYWLGRRAQLWAYNLDGGTSDVIATGTLSESPRFANGEYSLSFAGIMTELNRPIGTGWNTTPVVLAEESALGYTAAIVGDAREFSKQGTSHVRADWGKGFAVWQVVAGSINRTLDIVDLHHGNLVAWESEDGKTTLTDVASESDVTMRSCLLVTGDPADIALMVLHSDVGDGQNHASYDVLPGVSVALETTSADMTPKRWGAGLPSEWIDSDSWVAMRGVAGTIRMYLDEQTDLLDFLSNEIAWRLGGFVYVNGDGKIAFQQYRDAAISADFTIGRDDVLMGVVDIDDDETGIIGTAEVECNYDVRTRKFRHRVAATWVPTFATHGEGGAAIKLKSRTLQIGNPGPLAALSSPQMSELDVTAALDATYARTRNGLRTISVGLPWKFHVLARIGAVLEYTDDRAPDGNGAVGITSRRYEVTGYEMDHEQGTVNVTAEEMPAGWILSASAFVTSYNSGTEVITMDATGDEADLLDADLNPGEDLAARWYIRIYHVGASPSFSTSEKIEVDGVTGGSDELDLASTPTTDPVVGDLLVFEYHLPSSVTDSGAGYAWDDHLIMADDTAYPSTVSDSVGGSVITGGMEWG